MVQGYRSKKKNIQTIKVYDRWGGGEGGYQTMGGVKKDINEGETAGYKGH